MNARRDLRRDGAVRIDHIPWVTLTESDTRTANIEIRGLGGLDVYQDINRREPLLGSCGIFLFSIEFQAGGLPSRRAGLQLLPGS